MKEKGKLSIVISHYKTTKKIGHGGMADVFEAIDLKSHTMVALKVLHPHLSTESVVRKRFLREARVGVKLNHPSIVKIHEVSESNGLPFIAMELVKGRTLNEIIEHKPLPLRQAISIAQRIADALTVAHKQGIIHRDIKPGNIMIVDDRVKLMDFGLARMVDSTSLTDKHEVLGTLHYMSPEQVIGETVDTRSDIFSLGVVLYQMLTARRPFQGEHVGTIIHAILYAEPLKICDIDRSIPKEVEQVVFKALQKRNYRRYQSTIDLKSDLSNLDNMLDGRSVALIASDILTEQVFESHRGIHSELIGREKEIEELQKHLTMMLQGKSSAILLSGEAGIGKSRLAWELGQKAKKQDIRYLVGRCSAYGSIPYQPIIEVIRNYFEIKGIKTIQRLNAFLNEHAEHLNHRKTIVAAFAVEQIQEDITVVNKEQLWDTAAEIIKVIAKDRPIVLHLDDLHWADAPTLDMFTYILRTLNGNRVLIIGTYRPEDIFEQEHPLRKTLKSLNEEKLVHILSPTRLDKKRTKDVIHSVFKDTGVMDEFTDLIYGETEGNPLFILEVLKLLKDENIIIRCDKGWHINSDAIKVKIPKTVTDVILKRIKKLNKEEREIVEIAAVIGSQFNSDILEQCLEQPRIKILQSLQNLESSHNLIHTTKQGYQFNHGKINEVVYDNLIPELRKEYHKIIGRHLRELYSDRENHAAEIACHLFKAEQREHALPLFIRAGEHSRRLFANEEALTYFQYGMQIADEQSQKKGSLEVAKMKIAILSGSGKIKGLIGKYQAAIADLRTMISIAEETDDKRAHMLGLSELGKVLYKQSEYTKSIEFHEKALRMCRDMQYRQDEAEIVLNLAFVMLIKQKTNQAIRHLAYALKLSRKLHDRTHEGKSYGYYAAWNVERSKYKRAFLLFRKALRILKEKEHKHERAYILNQMGIALRHKTKFREALLCQKRSLSIYEEVGDKLNQVSALSNIGLVYYYLGNYTLAVSYYERGYQIARQIGELRFLAHLLNNLADTTMAIGQYKKALEYCHKALDIARKIGDEFTKAIIHRAIGWCQYYICNYESALKHCCRELKFARKKKYKRYESASLYLLTHIYHAQGDLSRALDCAESAVEIAEQISIEKGLWFYFTSLISLYYEIGDNRKASYTLKRTRAIIKKSKSKSARGWLFYYQSIDRFRHGFIKSAYLNIVKCRKIAKVTGAINMNISSCLLTGEIFLRKNNYSQALRYAREALSMAMRTNRKSNLVESCMLMARILMKKGNLKNAVLNAEEAVTIAEKHGIKILLWQAHHVLGKVYIKQSECARAQSELQQAKKTLDATATKLHSRIRKKYFRKKESRELFKSISKLKLIKGRKRRK